MVHSYHREKGVSRIAARMIRGVVGFLILVLVLLVLSAGITVWMARPVAAAICPSCFGFEHLQGQIFVQHGMTDKDKSKATYLLIDAENRIKDFYGSVKYNPRVLVCVTSRCIRRLGGGGADMGSIGPYVMLLSLQNVSVIDVSRLLALIEIQGRIGVRHMLMGSVPAWFEEGVAVLVSDDPQFIASPRGNRDRCLADPSDQLPVQMSDWNREAQEDSGLYASSACRVYRWMLARGGSLAVTRLLAEIANGESFNNAYNER